MTVRCTLFILIAALARHQVVRARPHPFTLFILIAALTGACAPAVDPLPIVATLERDRLELVAEARERIVEVKATEGDKVAPGDVLMRLDQRLYEADLARAGAVRQGAEQRLAELIRGPRDQRVETARAELLARTNALNTYRLEYDRIRALVDRRVMTDADREPAEGRVTVAEADVEAAEARLADLLDGTTQEQLAQARASVDEAEASIARIQLLADRMVIRAPRAGIVDALPYELGERPPAGATVVVMLVDGAPYARAYIPEPLRAVVVPGLEARIAVDGVAGAFQGRVRYVSADPAFTPYYALTERDRSRLSYVAEIILTEPRAARLPAGLPVEVDFPALRAPGAAAGR